MRKVITVAMMLVLAMANVACAYEGAYSGRRMLGIDLLRAEKNSNTLYVSPSDTAAGDEESILEEKIDAKLTALTGSELVTDGDFPALSQAWGQGVGMWVLTSGGMQASLGSAEGTYEQEVLTQTIELDQDERYLVTFTVIFTNLDPAINFSVSLGGTSTAITQDMSPFVSIYILAGATDVLQFGFDSLADADAQVLLDNVSVKRTATSATRPLAVKFLPGRYEAMDLTVSGDYIIYNASAEGVVLEGTITASGSPSGTYLYLWEHPSGDYPGTLTLTGMDDYTLYPSGRYYKQVFNYAASRTLTIADSRKIITNDGATGAVTYTLDTYTAAMEGCVFYIFDVEHTAGYDVTIALESASNDIIMADDGLAAGGDTVTLDGDRHQNITIIAIDGAYHVAGYTGTLTEGS